MLVTYFRMTNLYTWIFTLDRTSKLATLSSTVVFVPRRLNNIFVAVYLPGCRHKRTPLLHCMHRPAPGEDRNPGCYSVHNLLSNYDKHVGVTDLRFSKWKKGTTNKITATGQLIQFKMFLLQYMIFSILLEKHTFPIFFEGYAME